MDLGRAMAAAKKMTPDEAKLMMEMLSFYKRQFKQASRHYKPEEVIGGVQDKVDDDMKQLMTRPRADEVKCRAGCTACCRLHVDITPPEAKLLHYGARKLGVTIDRAKVERQAKVGKRWEDLPPEDRACVFLDAQGHCSVYEHRPMTCRKYLVLSDPELCDTIKHPGAQVLNFVSMEAEIAATAAMQTFGLSSLPVALLKSWPK